MRSFSTRRLFVLASALALTATACGGGGGGDATPASTSPPTTADDTGPDDTSGDTGAGDTDADDTGSDDTGSPDGPGDGSVGGPGDFTPGDERYRLVNLLDEPVDVYVRTEGLVRAYLMQAGVAPGEVTPFFAAPDGGRMVVLQAGADDPTCVATCPHILTSVRSGGDEGPRITSVLFVDDFGGQVRSFDAWEAPLESDASFANRMPDPDPDTGLIVPLAVALADNDFGMRLAIAGVAGCQENRDGANQLVGGTSTLPYAYDGSSVTVVFHDNGDRDCTGEVVGGPFTVTGGPGTRTLMVLRGAPGDLDALVLSLDDTDDADGPADTSGGDDAGDARSVALAEMTTFLVDNLGITATQAECLANRIVDGVGADRLVDAGGAAVDLDFVDEALGDELFGYLFAALGGCGLDPSILE